jgi:hypothetical protein
MKSTTPASRAPGESSVGMVCAATASTSAASPALRNDIVASPPAYSTACASSMACAVSARPSGAAAVARVAAMACRTDLLERLALSIFDPSRRADVHLA